MILYRVVAGLSRPLIRIAFRPRVRGAEQLPRRGGFVLAANHLSGFDVWAVSYVLYPRQLRGMGKNQLFDRPLLLRAAQLELDHPRFHHSPNARWMRAASASLALAA